MRQGQLSTKQKEHFCLRNSHLPNSSHQNNLDLWRYFCARTLLVKSVGLHGPWMEDGLRSRKHSFFLQEFIRKYVFVKFFASRLEYLTVNNTTNR
mmetsp:Transcript_14337/g.21479  ORF Transcript_14337/g.21479 Transcript_14337/m.21479 type:complete len:95 (+) Transcript_14337:690-974(+)